MRSGHKCANGHLAGGVRSWTTRAGPRGSLVAHAGFGGPWGGHIEPSLAPGSNIQAITSQLVRSGLKCPNGHLAGGVWFWTTRPGPRGSLAAHAGFGGPVGATHPRPLWGCGVNMWAWPHSLSLQFKTVHMASEPGHSLSVFVLFLTLNQGRARTQSPTTRNYAVEIPTFGEFARVSKARSAMAEPRRG